MARFSSTQTLPTDAGDISSTVEIEMPPEHLMIVLDKHAREQTYERDGTRVKAQVEEYPYEDASLLVRELRSEAVEVPGAWKREAGEGDEEASATGLEDAFDRALQEGKEALRKTGIVVATAPDGQDGRSLQVKVVYDGQEVLDFDGSGLGDVVQGLDPSSASATGLEGADPDAPDDPAERDGGARGAEEVADNGTTGPDRPRRPLGLRTTFRATSNGENDRIDAANSNTIEEIDSSLIKLSADAKVNVGLNAVLAIFIA